MAGRDPGSSEEGSREATDPALVGRPPVPTPARSAGRRRAAWRHAARARGAPVLACLGVAAAFVALALPRALAQWWLSPDAVGYVATAYHWVVGRGFVEPVVYSSYLPDLTPPAPAVAIRAPVLPVLLAVPLALGEDLDSLFVAHVVWSSLVAAGLLLVALRMLPLPAAAAFALAVTLSPAFLWAALHPWTEITALAMLLVVIGSAAGALQTTRGALWLAVLTLLAWLTRPNLGLLLPAVLLASVLELGLRGALRSLPLWIYAISFSALSWTASRVAEAIWGFELYAHYGLMAEILSPREASLFHKQYVGWASYLATHWPEVVAGIGQNLEKGAAAAFLRPYYLYAGWLAGPALAYGFLRGGAHSFERRLVAIAGLGLAATAFASYAGFDVRYLLPAAACVWLLAAGLASDLCLKLAAALPSSPRATRWRRALAALPPAAVLVLFAASVASLQVSTSLRSWRSYAAHGTRRTEHHLATGAEGILPAVREFCASMDRDALVASPDPWSVSLWCGNAGYWIPRDLGDLADVHRYLDERTPAYLVSDGTPAFAALARSPRLETVARYGRWILYHVLDAPPASRPWHAPPPLSTIGRAPTRDPSPASRE